MEVVGNALLIVATVVIAITAIVFGARHLRYPPPIRPDRNPLGTWYYYDGDSLGERALRFVQAIRGIIGIGFGVIMLLIFAVLVLEGEFP
jgi:hypothetical protein